MNLRLPLLSIGLMLLPSVVAAEQQLSTPVARVLKVEGKVLIQDQSGKQRAAEIYGIVHEREQLIVKDDADITLGFRVDGHMERLASACQATVMKKRIVAPINVIRIDPPRRHRRLVADTVKTLPTLNREGTRLLKAVDPDAPAPDDQPTSAALTPIDASTLLDPQPTFSWPPVDGALAYEVKLFDSENRMIWRANATGTSLALSDELQLVGGKGYTWRVVAKLKDEKSRLASRGDFTMATDQQRSEAKLIKELISRSDVEYLVLAASWYETNGLWAEAISVSRRLTELEPSSASAFEALATLYDSAGQWKEAETARQRALSIRTHRQKPAHVRSIFENDDK